MPANKNHFGSSEDYLSKHRSQSPSSRTILLTGATAGIGLAIANHLLSLKEQHLLILTGRNADVLNQFASSNPDRVITRVGDMADLDFAKDILQDVQLGGKLDGLVLNHGTLGQCLRMGQMDGEEWESVFRVNVTSCVVLIKEALPLLRHTKGRIIFTSSGAAVSAYTSWGAYGATKAAINHLTTTLNKEEPDITTVSIRPGVVDTAMQVDIREKFIRNMDEGDQQKFLSAKRDGKLLPPEKPGVVIAELAVRAEKDLSGAFLSWDDPKLAGYQR